MVGNKKGFTIIEIIITISIIAILAAVAVPSYNAIKERSELTSCIATRSNIEKIEQTYSAMNDYVHSIEYIQYDFITADCELVQAGYLYAEDITCPVSGEPLRWIPVNGQRVLYCSVHGIEDEPMTFLETINSIINNIAGNFNIIIADDNIDWVDGTAGDDNILGGTGDDRIRGGTGEDVIFGGGGVDVINGKDDDDYVFGEDGDDYLNGGLGDDYLSGGVGNDNLIGNDGVDTALYEGSIDRYQVIYDSASDIYTVYDTVTGDTDTLTTIEFISFDGNVVDITTLQ